MASSTSFLAALAVLPGKGDAPRVIQQFSSIFLVCGRGELWRVYDCATPEGPQAAPTAGSTLPVRIFVALANTTEVRARTFAPNEPRDVDPVSLQTQMIEATAFQLRGPVGAGLGSPPVRP
jgi:hypothetical protein